VVRKLEVFGVHTLVSWYRDFWGALFAVRLRNGKKFARRNILDGRIVENRCCEFSKTGATYVCAKSLRFGKMYTLLNADAREIIQEIVWLMNVVREYRSILSDEVNDQILKHKRPRKRVKRLGFDED
jgi:hypothetical protein